MSTTDNSDAHPDAPVLEGGVLAALPRTRPQRASARRVAARGKSAKSETAAAAPTTEKPARTSKAPAKKAKTATKPATKARTKVATKPATKAKTEPPAPTTRASHAKRKPSPPTLTEPPAPKQGYEPEEELEMGNTVNPPSGVELLESLTDIVSELAGSSLTAGGRLLKDAFSILRRP